MRGTANYVLGKAVPDKPAEPEFIQALCFEFATTSMPYQKTQDRVLLEHPKVGMTLAILRYQLISLTIPRAPLPRFPCLAPQ